MPPRRLRLTAIAGGALAAVASVAVLAQAPSANQAGAPSAAPVSAQQNIPVIQPPAVASAPVNAASPDESAAEPASSNSLHAKQAAAPPPAPPPVLPVRSPAAILQALDKVTAETMRFAVPVGQHVRYKNLVFTVKACETSGLGQPSPQASAYVVIDSAPLAEQGLAPPPPREVFHGWMFANSPGLNPFQHPVYDAWLIACMAAAPPA